MNIKLSSKTYDILKYIAIIVLPAIGTLYFAIAKIWGLPFGEEIVGTITAVDTFLGALLQLSKNGFEADGDITISSDDPTKWEMDLAEDVFSKKSGDIITFKVK